ncbi:unnamed protein product, partial [Durusdinium trenchii]
MATWLEEDSKLSVDGGPRRRRRDLRGLAAGGTGDGADALRSAIAQGGTARQRRDSAGMVHTRGQDVDSTAVGSTLVTAAKLRDCARAKRLQGAKNLTTAGGNAEHQGVLKAWSQSQVEELIQKLLQQKVLREEKESAGGKGKGGKGKWKAVKRLREGVNFEKFRNGDIVMPRAE